MMKNDLTSTFNNGVSKLARLIKSKQNKILAVNKTEEQIKIKIKKLIDFFLLNNKTWSRTYSEAYKYDSLTISDVDLENTRQKAGDVNKTFSIIKTKENHIWGYYRTVSGNDNWDSGQGVCFFNYKKDAYLTELNIELFFCFISLYKKKNKVILKNHAW